MSFSFTNSAAAVTFGSLALACSLGGTAHGVVIYQDDFSGTSADLNGQSPDVGSNNWVASSLFDADGDVNGAGGSAGSGSATLAFTPTDGVTYTLDASYTNTGGEWIAVGFANGQSSASNDQSRFITGTVQGRGWTIFRNGTGARNTFETGTAGAEPWLLTGDLGQAIDIRLVLFDADPTTGVDWQVDYFAKRQSDANYTLLRATPGNPGDDITSVGFAVNNATGSLQSFSLTNDVAIPEPGSLALLAGCGLLFARRRRG